jgi:drug/metabolite transporter (DMT)-like permease
MIAGMMVWVVYSLLVRRFVKGISSVVSTFYTLTGASLFLMPFILVMGVNPFSYAANIWYIYLFMGIFSTFIGYTLQQDSIQKIGVSRTNFFINFVPVFSMILGVLILGDQFKPVNLISLGFISTGLIGFLREKEKLVLEGV